MEHNKLQKQLDILFQSKINNNESSTSSLASSHREYKSQQPQEESSSAAKSNLPMHRAITSEYNAQLQKNKKYFDLLPCQSKRHQCQQSVSEGMRIQSSNFTTMHTSNKSTSIEQNQDQHQTQKAPTVTIIQPSTTITTSRSYQEESSLKDHPEIMSIRKLNSGILFNLPPPVSASSTPSLSMRRRVVFDLDSSSEGGVPTMEPEIDTSTRDTLSSRTSSTMPLHCMFEQVEESSLSSSTTAAAVLSEDNLAKTSATAATTTAPATLLPSSPSSSSSISITRTSATTAATATSGVCKRTSTRPFRKLTLSAYRKPEETVRLTDCDASRQLENEYNLRAIGCKVIGHGAFSTVRSALRNTDNIKVAIKSISKFDALRARRLRRHTTTANTKGSKSKQHMDEWEIMKLLQNNPYVLTLFDVFETETEIHLVTEYCMGGELFDAIKRKGTTKRSSFRRGRFTEPQAARITNQILKALVELHALGIVHRDIKAENILLLNGDESDIQVKLCDFGMARLQHHHHHQHQQQQQQQNQDNNKTTTTTLLTEATSDGEVSPSTPGLLFGTNAPPEGCHGNCIGPATDMFSMGVTLYILLCGFSPVFCEDVVEFPDAYWNDISEEAKDVVRSMLHHNPQERISAVDALKNAWIRQQTTRVRQGSISANLELVRSRLMRSLGGALGDALGDAGVISSSSSLMPSPPPTTSISGNKRRRGSSNFVRTTSPPKRSRICSFEKRDVRVIEERVESRIVGGEERGEGMALCS